MDNKNVKRTLANPQFMLRALFDSATDLIWMVDTGLRLISFNRSFEEWTASETGILIQHGQNIDAVVRPGWKGCWLDHHKKAIKNQEAVYQHCSSNGVIFKINMNAVKNEFDEICGLICVGKDVSNEIRGIAYTGTPLKEGGTAIDYDTSIICTINRIGCFMTVNQASETLWGYQPHELIGRPYIDWVCDDDRPKTLEIAEKVVTGINITNFENRYRHSSGSCVSMVWSANWHHQDQVMYCVARQISPLVQRGEEAGEAKFEKLLREGGDLIAVLDGSGVYTYVGATSNAILGFPPEHFIGKRAFDFIHPEDVDYMREHFQQLGDQNRIKLPLFRFLGENGAWRWIETVLTNHLDDPDVNGVVANSRDVTNRINAEKQLRDSEAKYRLLFDLNPMPMWIYDIETSAILDVNSTAIKSYGYSRNEFLNMSIKELRAPEDRHLLMSAQQRSDLPEGIHQFGMFTHLKKNGNRVIVEVSGHKYTHVGRKCMIVSCSDVTEREAILNDLKSKESKLRTALDIACLGYWEVDFDGRNRFWSDDVYTIWGVNKNEFVLDDHTLMQTIHPEDREHYQRCRIPTLGGNFQFDFEYRIVLSDGSVKWIREMGHNNTRLGNQKIEGTVQDITIYKELTISLAKSNERFEFVSKATFDAVWDWDLPSGNLFWGPGFETIFGHPQEVSDPTINSWTKYLHPEDSTRVSERIHAAIDGKESYWKDEYRFKKADGHYADVVDRGFIIRDEHGKAIRMVGAMHDISVRKNNMRNLKLLEAVVSQTTDAVLIAEVSKESDLLAISHINNAFVKMSGYDADEVLGSSPFLLDGRGSDKRQFNKLRNAIDTRSSVEITTLCYKKDGSTFWVNYSCGPVRDEMDRCTHFIFVYRDVTLAKRAEERLHSLMDDLYNRNKELRQFGYVVSHILRAPVASIKGLTNILVIEQSDPETVENCTQKLSTCVNQLDQAIFDLNKILAITDTAAEVVCERFDIKELLNQVIDDLSNELLHASICLSTPSRGRIIYSNKAYVYQILYHLLSNSIKYRSSYHPKISISIRRYPGGLRVVLADNGIGIDMAKFGNDLFKPYKRIEYLGEGKGLGLFLVKKYMEALKGKIIISSQPGEGTICSITLTERNVHSHC